VARFCATRSQRRTWKRNADIQVKRVAAVFQDEHYQLYQRYVAQRHPGGGMENYGPEQYQSFFGCRWGETWLYEFRCGADLLAVASVDHLLDGLSAVYTFFDPAQTQRGLGTYAVMWQISEAARLNLPHVYLGYWIAESDKMNYKTKFLPLEIYRNSSWINL
jgi:arginine-tRNA-protein transferase